ncbi:AMP-binding protein [Amycolatopsis sp. CA-230715]|uniref:AMP-binding protein n=1 Tax=Amycolatopsis sp. CA-230715 TaxID=2745196 RepID=UPI001C3345E0|nr:AMP-binding protein [Amycolatopsis sp. CA-230715]QWF86012.1 3-[(3aS,4S,7aS)-7a-methyl-1,5-dioxo-octahydro-1H-inden-4-yl]propanoyl:CoA ligase [Amycolatopsis sp. CA-230715]
MDLEALDLTGVCPLTTDEALRRAAAVVPEVEAVVHAHERVTYAELAEQVAALRSALHRVGVERGDHIGLCLGNGPRWVALFLAVTSLGAVTVPVNTRFKAPELEYALRQSDVKLLFLAEKVLSSEFTAMLREICPAVEKELPDPNLPRLARVVVLGEDVPAGALGWDEFTSGAGEPVEACSDPDDVALVQFTSGTTSFPKGVLLTHRNMCADAFFSGTRLGLHAGDRFYSGRPFFHVAGTTLSILACIQQLSTLVTAERFVPETALRLLADERCTHFAGNDTIALMLLNHPDRDEYRLSLRGAWLAASPTVVRRVIDELGAAETVVGYGLSEASPNVAQSAWWEDERLRVDGSMPPEPGVSVRVRDLVTGADAEPGQQGEILVRGWNVMRGYYAMPEQTAAVLDDDGWLSTGDLGVLRADGRLLFTGRAKELIRVGGENVAPTEVEAVLHRHPAIRQAAVVGVPDERLVEVPFAFVVLNGSADPSPGELLDWCRGEMAGFKVPHHLRIVDGFEGIGMTASAKIQKKQLAEHAVRLLDAR